MVMICIIITADFAQKLINAHINQIVKDYLLEIATMRASLTQRLAVIAGLLRSVLGTNLDSNGKDEEDGFIQLAPSNNELLVCPQEGLGATVGQHVV